MMLLLISERAQVLLDAGRVLSCLRITINNSWVPPGFAHGFVVLSDVADFEYKCTDYYDPSDEGSILWCDPDLGINWPVDNPILSDKDINVARFADLIH